MKLKDKVAVVTGASEGLGKQICLKLAKEGVNLALLARTKSKLEDVAVKSKKLGSKIVSIFPCDIRDNRQLKKAVRQIISEFDDVHILINNAGIWQKLASLEQVPEDVVEDVVKTNLIALMQLTRMLLPHLKNQEESAIINISSRSGVKAQKEQSIYSASKWGVTGFTEVLKEELKDTPIRVAGIYQGGVDTGMFRKTGERFDQRHFINPSDLADVVVFMLSRPKQIWLHDVRVEY